MTRILQKLQYLVLMKVHIGGIDGVFDAARRMDAEGTLSPFTMTSEWLNWRKPRDKIAREYGGPAPTMNIDLDIADWKKRRCADSVTYKGCTTWEYDPAKEVLLLKVWEGDNLYGHRKVELRCQFTVHGVTPELLLERFPQAAREVELQFQVLVTHERQRRECKRLEEQQKREEREIETEFMAIVQGEHNACV